MDLDRAVEHVHDHVGGHDLDHRDLLAGRALAGGVHLPGGHQGEQARLVDLHPALGDEVLDELLVGELAAERLARRGAPAHHLDRPLGGADRAHAVVDAAGAEAVLGDHEAGLARAEQVGLGHSAVLVEDLAVAGAAVVAHHRDGADEVEPGVVDGDDDHARPRVGVRVGVGDDHRDRDRGADGAGGEPLVAVDHPLVAVELGAGLKRRRVRARDLRLGHREAAADLAVEQGLEPPLVLLVACRARRGSPCSRCPGPSS